MNKIYTIFKRLTPFDVEVKDSAGRKKRLTASATYKVFDTVLATNGVIVKKLKKGQKPKKFKV